MTWQSKEWWKYFSNRSSMWWMICNYIRRQCWTLDKWPYYQCNCPSTFLHGNTIISRAPSVFLYSTFIIFHSSSQLDVFSMCSRWYFYVNRLYGKVKVVNLWYCGVLGSIGNILLFIWELECEDIKTNPDDSFHKNIVKPLMKAMKASLKTSNSGSTMHHHWLRMADIFPNPWIVLSIIFSSSSIISLQLSNIQF